MPIISGRGYLKWAFQALNAENITIKEISDFDIGKGYYLVRFESTDDKIKENIEKAFPQEEYPKSQILRYNNGKSYLVILPRKVTALLFKEEKKLRQAILNYINKFGLKVLPTESTYDQMDPKLYDWYRRNNPRPEDKNLGKNTIIPVQLPSKAPAVVIRCEQPRVELHAHALLEKCLISGIDADETFRFPSLFPEMNFGMNTNFEHEFILKSSRNDINIKFKFILMEEYGTSFRPHHKLFCNREMDYSDVYKLVNPFLETLAKSAHQSSNESKGDSKQESKVESKAELKADNSGATSAQKKIDPLKDKIDQKIGKLIQEIDKYHSGFFSAAYSTFFSDKALRLKLFFFELIKMVRGLTDLPYEESLKITRGLLNEQPCEEVYREASALISSAGTTGSAADLPRVYPPVLPQLQSSSDSATVAAGSGLPPPEASPTTSVDSDRAAAPAPA